MRAVHLCKELNISFETLAKLCEQFGFHLNRLNEIIPDNLASRVRHFFRASQKKANISVREPIPVTAAETAGSPKEFSNENPHASSMISLTLNQNPLDERTGTDILFEGKSVETIFSDFEAFAICAGLNDRHSRNIARHFFENKATENEKFEAHDIAMRVLKKYGSKTLYYVLSMPPLPFTAFDVQPIFSLIDKRKADQRFPVVRLLFKDELGNNQTIEATFYAEKIGKFRERNENVLSIRNRTTGKFLMHVSRNGTILPSHDARNILPVLQLFVRFSEDTQSYILNYGLETGECSVCGRPLTDPLSLRRGIGPVCFSSIFD